MEKPNFLQRNGKKVKQAVAMGALVFGAVGAAEGQKALQAKYDAIPNPITTTIDLEDIDVFQETYPLEIDSVQANWGGDGLNLDYYLSGRKYAQQVNFKEDKIKIPENLSVTHLLYFLKGIKEGLKLFEASGKKRDFTQHKISEKEKQRNIKAGHDEMDRKMKSKIGCGVHKKMYKDRRKMR